MDILSTFFNMNSQGGQLDDLFLTILNMSVTGALVICAVLLLRLALRRAPKKYSYWLWSAAGFRLLCPVSWRSVFSIFSLAPASSVAVETVGSAVPVSSMTSIPADIGMMPQPKVTLPVPQLSDAVNRVLPSADPLSSVNPVQLMLYIGALVWLTGMAAMLIWGAVSYLRLARRLRTAVRLEDGVWQSEAVGSPFLLGFLRPRIYLPYDLEGARLDYVLAHERFHIARRDHLVKLLAFLILCVHWYNPFVWLAFSLMGRDMEMRCDEAVLGRTAAKRRDYSETLLSFSVGGRFPSPGPLAFGESGVKARIRNALRWHKPRTWVTVTALLLALAGIAACTANPAEPEPEETGTPWDWTGTVTAAGLEGKYHDRTEATPEARPLYDLELLQLCDTLRAVPREAIFPGRGYPSQKWVTLTDGTAQWILSFGGDCVVLQFDDETAKQWPIDPENPAPSWEIHDQALLDCLDRLALNKLGVVVWLIGIQDGDYVVRRDGYGSFRVPMLPMDSAREPQIGDRLSIGYPGVLPEPGGRMDESSIYSLSIFYESGQAPATTAPPFSDLLRSEIIQDWKTHQPTDANLPGSVYRYFDTWAEATAWAGWTPENLLEDEGGWLEKKNTAGADVLLYGETDHAAVHARGDAEGNFLGLSLSAGYAFVYGDVRVQLTVQWNATGYLDFGDGEILTLRGDIPALASSDSGEGYLARVLRFQDQGAFYTIRLVSNSLDETALADAWDRLLGVYAEPVGGLNGTEATAPQMTVTSGGVTVAPYEMMRYEKIWSDEHGAWINADGIPLAAALDEAEEIPTLTLAEDFQLTFAEGVSSRAYPKVYDTDFELLEECSPAGTAQLFLLEPGEYYVVFPVSGPVGRYIAAEDAYEESGWDCLIRLTVERPLARSWTPEARPLSGGLAPIWLARMGT